MLDEQSSQAQNVLHTFVCLTRLRRARHKVLHKSLTMKHCFRLHFITPRQAAKAPQYEASPVFISLRRGKPFHSDMKHFAYAPYGVRKWKMRVYPFAIQRYPHYIMTCNPVLYGWIFLCLDFTQCLTGTYSVNSPEQRTNRERQILSKSVCFE